MLVLSRKRNESIVIHGDIIVTVVGIHGNRARIGIDAPGDVTIHRQEVADLVNADRREESLMWNRRDRRLLVVSNDDPTRSALADILVGKGGDVDTAVSSACALEYVDEKKYDVAIIDETLNSTRGEELFERMRNYQSHLKGILCSSYPTIATVEAALDSGMEHVIQKPVDEEDLLSRVWR